MLIDPHRDGCTIYAGNKVQWIKGDADECCKKIIEFVAPLMHGSKYHREQHVFNIMLDTAGYGMAYAYCFQDNGIQYEEVKPGKII